MSRLNVDKLANDATHLFNSVRALPIQDCKEFVDEYITVCKNTDPAVSASTEEQKTLNDDYQKLMEQRFAAGGHITKKWEEQMTKLTTKLYGHAQEAVNTMMPQLSSTGRAAPGKPPMLTLKDSTRTLVTSGLVVQVWYSRILARKFVRAMTKASRLPPQSLPVYFPWYALVELGGVTFVAATHTPFLQVASYSGYNSSQFAQEAKGSEEVFTHTASKFAIGQDGRYYLIDPTQALQIAVTTPPKPQGDMVEKIAAMAAALDTTSAAETMEGATPAATSPVVKEARELDIPMRYLGFVYTECKTDKGRSLVVSEMCARAIRELFAAEVLNARSGLLNALPPLANKFHSAAKTELKFWTQCVLPMVALKYGLKDKIQSSGIDINSITPRMMQKLGFVVSTGVVNSVRVRFKAPTPFPSLQDKPVNPLDAADAEYNPLAHWLGDVVRHRDGLAAVDEFPYGANFSDMWLTIRHVFASFSDDRENEQLMRYANAVVLMTAKCIELLSDEKNPKLYFPYLCRSYSTTAPKLLVALEKLPVADAGATRIKVSELLITMLDTTLGPTHIDTIMARERRNYTLSEMGKYKDSCMNQGDITTTVGKVYAAIGRDKKKKFDHRLLSVGCNWFSLMAAAKGSDRAYVRLIIVTINADVAIKWLVPAMQEWVQKDPRQIPVLGTLYENIALVYFFAKRHNGAHDIIAEGIKYCKRNKLSTERFDAMMEQVQVRRRDAAVRLIQRGWLAHLRYKREMELKRKMSVVLQAAFRATEIRRRMGLIRNCQPQGRKKIHRVFRGYRVRLRIAHFFFQKKRLLKQMESAFVLQAFSRGYQARRDLGQKRAARKPQATLTLNRVGRGYRSRKELGKEWQKWSKYHNKHTRLMVRVLAGFAERKALGKSGKKTHEHAIMVQRFVFAKISELLVAKMRDADNQKRLEAAQLLFRVAVGLTARVALSKQGKHLHGAAAVVQVHLWAHASRQLVANLLEMKRLREEAAVALMMSVAAGYRTRLEMAKKKDDLVAAVRVAQRFLHAYAANVATAAKTIEWMKRQLEATFLMQRCARGYTARTAFQGHKTATNNHIIVVQRELLAYAARMATANRLTEKGQKEATSTDILHAVMAGFAARRAQCAALIHRVQSVRTLQRFMCFGAAKSASRQKVKNANKREYEAMELLRDTVINYGDRCQMYQWKVQATRGVTAAYRMIRYHQAIAALTERIAARDQAMLDAAQLMQRVFAGYVDREDFSRYRITMHSAAVTTQRFLMYQMAVLPTTTKAAVVVEVMNASVVQLLPFLLGFMARRKLGVFRVFANDYAIKVTQCLSAQNSQALVARLQSEKNLREAHATILLGRTTTAMRTRVAFWRTYSTTHRAVRLTQQMLMGRAARLLECEKAERLHDNLYNEAQNSRVIYAVCHAGNTRVHLRHRQIREYIDTRTHEVIGAVEAVFNGAWDFLMAKERALDTFQRVGRAMKLRMFLFKRYKLARQMKRQKLSFRVARLHRGQQEREAMRVLWRIHSAQIIQRCGKGFAIRSIMAERYQAVAELADAVQCFARAYYSRMVHRDTLDLRRRQIISARLLQRYGRGLCGRGTVYQILHIRENAEEKVTDVVRGFMCRKVMCFMLRARKKAEVEEAYRKMLQGDSWDAYYGLLKDNENLKKELDEQNAQMDQYIASAHPATVGRVNPRRQLSPLSRLERKNRMQRKTNDDLAAQLAAEQETLSPMRRTGSMSSPKNGKFRRIDDVRARLHEISETYNDLEGENKKLEVVRSRQIAMIRASDIIEHEMKSIRAQHAEALKAIQNRQNQAEDKLLKAKQEEKMMLRDLAEMERPKPRPEYSSLSVSIEALSMDLIKKDKRIADLKKQVRILEDNLLLGDTHLGMSL